MGNEQTWEYQEHFHAIGMTGDYDGHYEVTNGNISLCTNDDPEDITETENTLQKVARVLNEADCKFYCNTTTEHKLHVENMELRYKIDDIRDQAQAMADALEKHKEAYDQLAKEAERKYTEAYENDTKPVAATLMFNMLHKAYIEASRRTSEALKQFKDGREAKNVCSCSLQQLAAHGECYKCPGQHTRHEITNPK